MSIQLSELLKLKAIDLGATVVGIADGDGFESAPEGHKPRDILEGATGVVSIGVAQPKAVLRRAMPTQYTRNIFTTAAQVDGIASQLSLWIEDHGFEAIPISARFMYMDAMSGVFRGDLSHKHTAMLAGLGEIGLNTLLINPKYGTRLLLASVVTDAPLSPDAPFGDVLCSRSGCLKCIKVCPVNALSESGNIDKLRCARHYRQYADIYFETGGLYFCRECRKVCPICE